MDYFDLGANFGVDHLGIWGDEHLVFSLWLHRSRWSRTVGYILLHRHGLERSKERERREKVGKVKKSEWQMEKRLKTKDSRPWKRTVGHGSTTYRHD